MKDRDVIWVRTLCQFQWLQLCVLPLWISNTNDNLCQYFLGYEQAFYHNAPFKRWYKKE